MKAEVIVALLAAGAALLSALIALWSQMRVFQLTAALDREKREEAKRDSAERVMERYKEPLIQAAYDLQSRLFNICARDFLGAHYIEGTEQARQYSVDNTVFLIAQYFGWNEIIRREARFLNHGDQGQTQKLSNLRNKITNLWGSDRSDFPDDFRVFAGEQRAIGERMIVESAGGLDCMGYADFVDAIRHHPTRIPYLDILRNDVANLAQQWSHRHQRLMALHGMLIELLYLLDPEYTRFPKEWRTKLSNPSRVGENADDPKRT